MQSQSISSSSLLFYALPWFYVQIVNLPMVNFVPGFYASDLRIPLLEISLVLLLARGLDVFTDPLIGYLGDRTRSRFGRRKPWIAAGVPVLIIGAWLLFVPPAHADALHLLIAISITYLGFTLIQISFVAWGAELSDTYDGRSRVAGLREGIGMVGTITAIASPLIAAWAVGGGIGEAMFGIAIALVFLGPLLTAPALILVPEKKRVVHKEDLGWIEGVRAILSNKPFRVFVLAAFFIYGGFGPPGALSYVMFKDVFQAETLFPYSILGTWLPTILVLPFWLWLSRRTSKHFTVIVVLIYSAIVQLTLPAVLWFDLDPIWAVIQSVFTGIGFGALLTLPYSIIADIIDEDQVQTGQQRSGLYMALGGVIVKFALMLGVALGLAWPAWFGFEAGSTENSFAAELQVLIGSSWITAGLYLCAAAVLSQYRLGREEQQALRRELAVET